MEGVEEFDLAIDGRIYWNMQRGDRTGTSPLPSSLPGHEESRLPRFSSSHSRLDVKPRVLLLDTRPSAASNTHYAQFVKMQTQQSFLFELTHIALDFVPFEAQPLRSR